MAQDYTALRVTEAAKAEAEASKRDDETWSDYVRRCTDNPPETREFVEASAVGGDIDEDDLADAVARRFDYAAVANKAAEAVVEALR